MLSALVVVFIFIFPYSSIWKTKFCAGLEMSSCWLVYSFPLSLELLSFSLLGCMKIELVTFYCLCEDVMVPVMWSTVRFDEGGAPAIWSEVKGFCVLVGGFDHLVETVIHRKEKVFFFVKPEKVYMITLLLLSCIYSRPAKNINKSDKAYRALSAIVPSFARC